jgi:hypothetical protein
MDYGYEAMSPRQQLYLDYARLFVFVNKLLDPECYGFAVTAEVRDAARLALGLDAVEARHPAQTQPGSYRHEGVHTQVERISLDQRDK